MTQQPLAFKRKSKEPEQIKGIHHIDPKPKTLRKIEIPYNPKTRKAAIAKAKELCEELEHVMYKVGFDHGIECLASRCKYCGLKFILFNYRIEGPAMDTLCMHGGKPK